MSGTNSPRNLGHFRFPFVRSDLSNQERTSSGQNGPAYGSEPLSYHVPVGQYAGLWRVVAGKMYARALDLSI